MLLRFPSPVKHNAELFTDLSLCLFLSPLSSSVFSLLMSLSHTHTPFPSDSALLFNSLALGFQVSDPQTSPQQLSSHMQPCAISSMQL